MKIKPFFYIILTFFTLCGAASASVSYNAGDNHIDVDDSSHNTLTSVCNALNDSKPGQTYLTHTGKVWRMKAALHYTGSDPFFINSTDASELRISNSVGYDGLLGANFRIENVTLGSWNVAQNRYATKPINSYNTPERQVRLDLGQRGWIRNCKITGAYGITYTGNADGDIYGLTMSNGNAWAIDVDEWDGINIRDVYISNFADGGINIEGGKNLIVDNFTVLNVGNYLDPASGNYGLDFSCNVARTWGNENCTAKNGYVDGTGWSGVGEGGWGDAIPYNCKFINLTIKNAGHNGLDLHGGSLMYVENVSIYESISNNFYSTSKDVYAKDLYLYKTLSGDQMDIGNPGWSQNHTFENVYMYGNVRGIVNYDEADSIWINITNDATDDAFVITSISEPAKFPQKMYIIDSKLSTSTIWDYGCADLRFVNTKFGTIYLETGATYKTYYYPNIIVKDLNGTPINGVTVTCSNAVNGYGQSQGTFYTDSTGKLNGNRSNWLAIPSKSTITASKNGVSGNITLTPADSWYSNSHDNLQASLQTITLGITNSENNTTVPPDTPEQEIKFSPSDTILTKNLSEKVDFSVSPDIFTTKEWYVGGDLVQNNTVSMSKSWSIAGTYNVTFIGSGSEEPVLHTWTVSVIEEPKDDEVQNKSIITISPEFQIITPKKSFDLGIKVEPGTQISGTQLDFVFNSSMTLVNNVTEGDLLKQSGAYTIFSNGTVDNSAGTVKNIYGFIIGTSNVFTPGTMSTINLTAGSKTGFAKFSLSNVLISDADSKSVPYTVTNATVLIDTAPLIVSIEPKSVDEKSTLAFKVSAKDADGDRLVLSASGLPQGAVFNTTTGNFTWTPAIGQAGVYTFTFVVNDGYLTDSENVTVTVNKPNHTLVINYFEPLNGSSFSEGERIGISVNASDADGQALNYSIRIDGVVYTTNKEYVWETDYSSSGNHTIEVVVSDGIDEVKVQNTIFIADCHPRWDVDENGIVNILDITMVSKNYGTTVNKPYPRHDVNQDGVVNILDLTLVGNHFGELVK